MLSIVPNRFILPLLARVCRFRRSLSPTHRDPATIPVPICVIRHVGFKHIIPYALKTQLIRSRTTVKMSSSNRDLMFGPDEVAQLAAAQMEKYGMTPSPSEPRHPSEALKSSNGVNGSVPLAVQIEEDRQIMATLATRPINSNRTIELLNAVVDAKDESVEELATECGQNRKDLARSSGQVSALAAELAEVQSELTLVTSRDSKVSRDSA